MYLVVINEAYFDSEEKYEFQSLTEANNFLYEGGFVYDSFDDDTQQHLWVFGEYIYGTVEKIRQ